MKLRGSNDPVTPESDPEIENADLIIENALEEGRDILTQAESKAVLAAFHIPIG